MVADSHIAITSYKVVPIASDEGWRLPFWGRAL